MLSRLILSLNHHLAQEETMSDSKPLNLLSVRSVGASPETGVRIVGYCDF